MSGCCLIKRVKRAAEILTWEGKQKFQQLAGTLRDVAYSWWDSLAHLRSTRTNGMLSRPIFSSHLTWSTPPKWLARIFKIWSRDQRSICLLLQKLRNLQEVYECQAGQDTDAIWNNYREKNAWKWGQDNLKRLFPDASLYREIIWQS